MKEGSGAQGQVGRPPGFAKFRNRSDVERSARRVANMVIAEQIDPQEAHAILHAIRQIYDSLKLTEEVEAEYRLKEIADQARETRETNQALYQRLVDLGVAPTVGNGS